MVSGRQRHPGGEAESYRDRRQLGDGPIPTGATAGLRPDTSPGHRPVETGLCAGPNCGALILWATTLEGRRMPLNPDPDPDGIVVMVTDQEGRARARVLTGRELPAQCEAWMPHHRACPDADAYRERKARTAPRCTICSGPMDPDLARQERWVRHPSCDSTGLQRKRPTR